jgi:hypothetical protein
VAERISHERVVRERGYLYFLGKDGYLWRTPTKLNTAGSKARVGSEKVAREDGWMYFLDKDGFVSRAKMKDGILPEAASPGSLHAPKVSLNLVCPSCGYSVRSDFPMRFCARCGTEGMLKR